MAYKLLFVDDEPYFRIALRSYFERKGFEVEEAESGPEALESVASHPDGFAVVVVDYQMRGLDGAATVAALRELNSDLNLVLFSGKGKDPLVLKAALKVGPLEFIDKKGDDFDELELIIRRLCAKYEQVSRPVDSFETKNFLESIPCLVGCSTVLATVARQLDQLKDRKTSILVLGENGTEKEEIAQFLAEPKKALESHLELEIQNLSESQQERLVVVAREGKRLVATACPGKELEQIIRPLHRIFRKATVEVPPLRDRVEDIEPIVADVNQHYQEETGVKRTIQKRTLQLLANYPWPGNVKELRKYVLELIDWCPDRQVGPSQLDSKFFVGEEEAYLPTFAQFEKAIDGRYRRYLQRALSRWEFNKDRTAREIGMSPTGLRRKIYALGLNQEEK